MQPRSPKILLLVLAAWTFGVSVSGVQAESWAPAAISADHDSWLFIDWASLKRSKSPVTVHIMTEYYEDQPGRPETNYLACVGRYPLQSPAVTVFLASVGVPLGLLESGSASQGVAASSGVPWIIRSTCGRRRETARLGPQVTTIAQLQPTPFGK